MKTERMHARIMLKKIGELSERHNNCVSAYLAEKTQSGREIMQTINAEAAAMDCEYKKLCETVLRDLGNTLYAKILHLKYFEGKTLAEVADELHYSAGYIRNLHCLALDCFAESAAKHGL